MAHSLLYVGERREKSVIPMEKSACLLMNMASGRFLFVNLIFFFLGYGDEVVYLHSRSKSALFVIRDIDGGLKIG